MSTIDKHVRWLRERGKREGWSLAGFTGQDSRALRVFIAALELYSVSDGIGCEQAKTAMRAAVRAMQSKYAFTAKKVIPAVLDWSDEERIWKMLGFDVIAAKLDEVFR